MTVSDNQSTMRHLSQNLPKQINPWQSCKDRPEYQGVLTGQYPSNLPTGGEAPLKISCKLQLDYDREKRPLLSGELDCILELICERCLQPIEESVHSQFSYLLVRSEAEEQRIDEGWQTWLCPSESLDIADFLYEELALNMPLYHKHADCQNPYLEQYRRQSAADERQYPLQDLRKLLDLKEK